MYAFFISYDANTTMGLTVDDHNEPRSTPKLSLSKLPCKPKQSIHMLTPPLHPSASVPFQWEEVPGKARSSAEEEARPPPAAAATSPPKSRAVRCLHLPARLLHEDAEFSQFTMTPSRTVVLDGPYVGRSLSLACTFSFRKGLGSGRAGGLRPAKKGGSGTFGSRRWRSWGSFKFGEEEKVGRGSFDFSQSLEDLFKSEKSVKMTRLRRASRSFFDLSAINSNLLDFYARFKQAIPWRRRR